MATLYWVVYPSAQADPTATDIINETVTNGIFGSDTAPTETTDPFTGDLISGLMPDTSYKLAVVWDDGSSTSDVAVSEAFVTEAIVGRVKYFNGTSWEVKPLKRFDGTSWQPVVLKYWNNSSWVE